ncbi:hypothetical protein P5V15_003832 [Pogonomyrmex californicus]
MENGSFTVSQSPEDTAKQFQVYLRKYENDDKLVILEAVNRPGSKLGDNYTSMLMRTKLVGTRGDGSPYVKTFMCKMIIKDRNISKLLELSDLFRMEAHAYTKVLPIVGPSFGPQCIYADENTIIMDDLAGKGYVNCERRDFLDMDHTVYALKRLAKLHASSLNIKINNPRQFEKLITNLEEVIYKDNSKTSVMRSCTEMCIKSMLQYLELMEPQTEELQAIKDYISPYVEKAYDTLRGLFTAPKQKYHAICHGDPWINNLLYLHDKDGKIIDLKMVDYQIIRHISPSTDILYFIYSSVQESLIERSFESLIKIYHNEFFNELRRLHMNEKILAELGMEWLQTELRTYALYGILVGCTMVNAILAEDEDVQRFEALDFGPLDPIYSTNTSTMINRKKINRVRILLTHYHRRFVLGIINDIEPIPITG